ncbi:TIGR01244 family phosphatase [Marinomonas sp. A79]|uniref:TIGR01244 family phosphatase n=1 Tax=Marinomonas vulgaris TaxID=2823372 RepID=A0ABS5HDH5_9GAMM|nr:TIGR01244 family sulfur transferase [Marinomonas vulgaris]MBR7889705.1 TIGR01244 family phosphatase [Marinomonas vulgaris]
MSNPIELDVNYFAVPQLLESDLESIKAQGFQRVINNRPENEAEDQPNGESLRLAVEAMGMEYVANPIDLSKFSQVQVDTQAAAIAETKKTVAFCRTGTRSTVLWVLLENAKGKNYDDLVTFAGSKGFDLGRCQPAMQPLAK